MEFPTREQVRESCDDHVQLARWCRFLPSPTNDEDRLALADIIEDLKAHGGITPVISKIIGWSTN